MLDGARGRAGLAHATCHELRHTCFTRLREAGMALEAIQARAGHRSVETTRVYLHLAADGWLAEEYRKAIICSTEKVVDGTGISASEVISNKGTQSLSTRCRPR
ncbi:MAG TPA: tyrosine-type recombinase/integrase [Micromonosporaceae bacterium]|nr:tyrosine-type recombinase/integrase [Micromonosporaceae bacterium]